MRMRMGWSAIPLLLGIGLLALFVRLGLWQLDRAQLKQDTVERFEHTADRAPEAMDRYDERPRYTPVRLAGRYLEPVIFLDNQLRDGRPGVHVFVPFQPFAGGPQLLVNLGWRPIGARRELPEVNVPQGDERVEGLLSDPPPVGIRLGEPTLEAPPHRVPYLDPELLAERLNLRLAPQILLATGEDEAYVRDWRPSTAMPPERHRAYAWQWFSLAAAVFVLLVYGLWRARRSLSEKADDE